MVRELYENAKRGIDTRQNLSALRSAIKDDALMNDLFELVEDDIESMKRFLDSDDAKVRKNAALLMGELDMSDFVQPLVNGYRKESQLFVKSAYLEALKGYDIEEYLPFFKERVRELSESEITPENRKHIDEEMRALTELIVSFEGVTKHCFTGFRRLDDNVEGILITNKLNMDVTKSQLSDIGVKLLPFKGGVRFTTDNLSFLKDVRTYSDVLFVIPGSRTSGFDAGTAAKTIAESGLLKLLDKLHRGEKNQPFYFRVELKSTLDMEKKGKFVRRFSAELERQSGRRLINSASDYEIELRLIENKDHELNMLLKLYTINDERFSYFKKHIAASIKPVNAALMVELAKEYMIPDAQVLDPFCGVGTMLIERQKIVKANTSYGLDINAEAITGAKENTQAAEQIVHYVNRDFFTFEHDYLFDEIFTDMPFALNDKVTLEIDNIYKRFFKAAALRLTDSGRIIMYSRNPQMALKYSKSSGYRILKRIAISEKNNSELIVFEHEG